MRYFVVAILLGLVSALNLSSCRESPKSPYEALYTAAQAGDTLKVKSLLSDGADVHRQTTLRGDTALSASAERGHDKVVTLLLQAGADPNSRNKSSWRPLHFAARNGHAGTVRILLASGANPNASQEEGGTPLHAAAQGDSLEVARILIEHGANINAVFREHFTPIHVAVDCDSLKVAQLLIDSGVNINEKVSPGTTLLHSAVANGKEEAVEFLLKNGADAYMVGVNGLTPASIAKDLNNSNIRKLIKKYSERQNR